MEYRPYNDKIMDECTFKPKLHKQNSRMDSEESRKCIKGYDHAIQRYRIAAEEKRKLKEKIERSARGANYEEIRKKKIQPFKSNVQEAKDKKMPLIVIEATVMPGKVIKIPLYETDNAEEVARNFSKIYHLSKESQNALTRVIKEQLDFA